MSTQLSHSCKSINPCKTTATGGPGGQMAQAPPGVRTSRELAAAGHAIIHPEQAEVCHAHGKRRGPTQLYQVSTVSGPQWECLPEARCKVAGEQPDQSAQLLQQIQMGNQFNPYGSMGMSNEALLGLIGGQGGGRAFGMGGARVAGGGGIQQQLCSVHQKKRSLQSLQMNPTGMWVCKDTDQCKTKSADTGGLGMCSVHNKYVHPLFFFTWEGHIIGTFSMPLVFNEAWESFDVIHETHEMDVGPHGESLFGAPYVPSTKVHCSREGFLSSQFYFSFFSPHPRPCPQTAQSGIPHDQRVRPGRVPGDLHVPVGILFPPPFP